MNNVALSCSMCSDPNLQNIPIRTTEGQRVRRAFIPSEPGWKFVCADYSQIELRMLAHFCGDPVLCEAFAVGTDIHTAVACEIFNVTPDSVSSEQRRIAKDDLDHRCESSRCNGANGL